MLLPFFFQSLKQLCQCLFPVSFGQHYSYLSLCKSLQIIDGTHHLKGTSKSDIYHSRFMLKFIQLEVVIIYLMFYICSLSLGFKYTVMLNDNNCSFQDAQFPCGMCHEILELQPALLLLFWAVSILVFLSLFPVNEEQ